MNSTRSGSGGLRNGALLDKIQDFGECMGELILLGIMAGLGIWLYNTGKRIGRRKGFYVGRRRGRS